MLQNVSQLLVVCTYNYILVGGLEHCLFSTYWESHHPN